MKRGFTLIELIIVVIVIGILAGIALPQFFRVAERARAAELVNVLGALRSAQARYFSEYGRTGLFFSFGSGTPTGNLDVDISAGDSRYIYYIYARPNVNLRTQPTDNIALVYRNLEDNAYGYYYFWLRANGRIGCFGNADACRAAGYPSGTWH